MKKLLSFLLISAVFISLSGPVLAESPDIARIQSFVQSVIQILVTMAGLLAAGFIVFGGIRYITSSGNPEALESSKRTIIYAAVGLTISLGAFVISNIIAQLAGAAFGR